MEHANKRNEAMRIESALLNKIALIGTEKTAAAVGVDKAQISRWKRDWIPKFSMLLAVLEWGVVDDEMARLARQVASILTKKNVQLLVAVWTLKHTVLRQVTGVILMVKQRFIQDEIHKNVARERFIRTFSREAAEKLKQALELSKRKLEKPE